MIEEKAFVVDADGQYAWVETQRQSTCGACSAKTGCGTQVIGKVVGNRRNQVRVLNTIGAKIGDQIIVGLEEGAMVRGSLAMYFMPLVGLFAGGAFGGFIFGNAGLEYTEGWQILSSLAGLGAGLAWLKGFSKRIHNDERYQAVALRKYIPEVKFIAKPLP